MVRLLVFLLALMLAAPASAQPAAERLFTPAELRADFADMYRRLQGAHIDLYAFTPKRELDRAYAEALAELDRPMSRYDAEVRLQRFLARVRMGHTRIDVPRERWAAHQSGGGRIFPLGLRIIGERVYVAANHSGLASIRVGDEIVRLNGAPVLQTVARLRRNISAESDYMSGALLEFWAPRLIWLEYGPRDSFELQLRGRPPMRLPARTRAEIDAAAAAQPKPLDLETPLREAKVLPGGVGYLRPGPFYNAEAADEAAMFDEAAFVAFIDRSFEQFLAAGVRTLIIDVRGNPGGDSTFSDPMIAWFADRPFRFFSEFKVRVSPEAIAANQARLDHNPQNATSRAYAALYARSAPGSVVDNDYPFTAPRPGPRFTGEVYLLVDRHSYSNTVTVAAIVQDYGFGTVIGEETSDMASTYGAMETFTLPVTGIRVGFPKARIIRPNGDRRSRGVVPGVTIAMPVLQTADDPVLQSALAIVTRGATRSAAPRRGPNAPPSAPGP